MQSPQKLKKGEAAAASKKPALITGQALPEIDSSPLTDDSNQKLQPDNIDQSPVSADPDTVGTESGSVAPQTQNSTTTTNPQPAASASPNITNNINSSKTKIKVDVGATLNKLMSGL